MKDIVFSIISSIISAPLGLIHLLILSGGWKYSKKKTCLLTALYLVLLLAADMALLANGGTLEEIKRWISIVNIAGCLFLHFIISEYRDGRMFFSFFSACISIFISDTIADIAFYSEAVHLYIKIFTFLMIALLLYRFFRNPFLDILQTIKDEWWWLMMVPLSLCFAFAMIIMVPGPLFQHPEMQAPAICMCFACIFSYIAFYVVFKNMQKQHEMEENNQLLKMQIRHLEKQTDILHGMSERIRISRHDTRHYVRMLTTCIDNQDWESAATILEQIDSKASSMESGEILSLTGEGVLDAVLHFYKDWAKKEQVALEIHITAPPEEKTNITEFSAMISNALENAMHACCAIESPEKRKIFVRSRLLQNQYCMEIANTYEGSVEFDSNHRPVVKSEKHGYGTRSMVNFAEKNQRWLEFGTKDGWFFVRIIL